MSLFRQKETVVNVYSSFGHLNISYGFSINNWGILFVLGFCLSFKRGEGEGEGEGGERNFAKWSHTEFSLMIYNSEKKLVLSRNSAFLRIFTLCPYLQ